MTDRGVTESVVEQAALAWLESLGWAIRYHPAIDFETLPPKLVSGELRVADPKTLTEAAK